MSITLSPAEIPTEAEIRDKLQLLPAEKPRAVDVFRYVTKCTSNKAEWEQLSLDERQWVGSVARLTQYLRMENALTISFIGLKVLHAKGWLHSEHVEAAREEVAELWQPQHKKRRIATLEGQLESTKQDLEQANREATQSQLSAAEARMNSQRQKLVLEQQEGQLQETERQLQTLQAHLNRMGPVAPIYQMQLGDPQRLEGAYAASESEYAQTYNNIDSLQELVAKAIGYNCETLFARADAFSFEQLSAAPAPEGVRSLHLNRSEAMVYQPEMEGHRVALIAYALLHLMQNAAIINPFDEAECSGDLKIELNNQKIRLLASQPVRIPGEGNSERIVFRNPQLLAMTPHAREFPYGIDPLSLKWILLRLGENERRSLETLILDPFMLFNQTLRQAHRAKLESELIAKAYDLLFCMTRATMRAFPALVGQTLARIFTDETTTAFIRTEGSLSAPPLANRDLIPWELGTRYFEEEQYQVLAVENHTRTCEAWARTPQGWFDSSEQLTHLRAREQLGQHFEMHHEYEVGSICYLSALARVTFGARATPQSAMSVLGAIRNFLLIEANQERFAERVQRETGKTMADFVPTLFDNPGWDQADILIELYAWALGVQIGVFVDSMPVQYNAQGLLQPSHLVGPNTREKLFLYHQRGYSFWGLVPKWPELSGSQENLPE